MRGESETDGKNSVVSDATDYIEEIHSIEQDWQDISECFQPVGISPLKVHAQPLPGRVKLGKRKLDTAISTIQEKIARAFNVTTEEINLDNSTTEDVDLLRIKAENFDKLMQVIKKSFKQQRQIDKLFRFSP